MIDQINEVLQRTKPTLLQDTIGAMAIVVMLLVALHLPGAA